MSDTLESKFIYLKYNVHSSVQDLISGLDDLPKGTTLIAAFNSYDYDQAFITFRLHNKAFPSIPPLVQIPTFTESDEDQIRLYKYLLVCQPLLNQGVSTSYVELIEPVTFKPFEPCSHIWQNYVGLTNSYKFCTKCNIKES